MRTLLAVLFLSACGGAPCTDAPLAPCREGGGPHNVVGTWSLTASQSVNRCGLQLDQPLVVTGDYRQGPLEATLGAVKLNGQVDSNGGFDFWNETLSVRGSHVLLMRGQDELRGGVSGSDCERWQFVARRGD